MTNLEEEAVEILAPAASFAMGLMFPAIPAVVWSTIFAALKNGDLTRAAFDAFLAEHGLKVYTEAQPGDVTPIYPIDKNSGVQQQT
jgi:hypothetical protein